MRSLSALAIALAIASPASAEWTKAQRAGFLKDCVEGCQLTPGLSAAGKATCPKSCDCLANQGEKIMTPADYDAAEKAAGENKETAKMKELATHQQACAQQATGK